MAENIDFVFRDYNTPSNPASGEYEPEKPRIRSLLWSISNSSGQSITVGTEAELNLVTPPTEFYGGIVLDDPDPTRNGYYSRESEIWVRQRGFPDTFAHATFAGSGSAQTMTFDSGVNPADVLVFIGTVTTENTGPLTLDGIDVVNAAGNALSAGEWTGTVLFYLNGDGEYQLLFDAGAVAAAAQSATDAAHQKGYAEEWAQSPDPISVDAGGDGATDRSSKYWAEQAGATALPDGSVTDPKLNPTLKAALVANAANRTVLASMDGASYQVVNLMEAGRRGLFQWDGSDLSSEVAADAEQGIYVAPAGDTTGASGAWVRRYDGPVLVTWFGASPDNDDNTAAYDALIAACPEGTTIAWPDVGGAVWRGSFVSSKAFHLSGGAGNKRTHVTNVSGQNEHMLAFVGSNAVVTTLTANATYGDKTLTMASTAALSAGSIIMLEDGKNRPSDSTLVNQEIIKIRSVDSATEVTVEDMVRSDQDTGTRNVYLITPVTGASIRGFHCVVTDPRTDANPTGHGVRIFTFTDCEDVEYEDVSVNNSTGRAVDFTRVYDFRGKNTSMTDPASSGSGQGYGTGVFIGRKGKISGVHGRGSRHTLDLSACYDVEFDGVRSENCSNSDVGLCHNMFGGFIRGRDIKIINGGQYGVNLAIQSMTYPFIARDFHVSDVDYYFNDPTHDGYAVYLQLPLYNCSVKNVLAHFSTAGIASVGHRGVRVNGTVHGLVEIENIATDGAGIAGNKGVAVAFEPYSGSAVSAPKGLLRLKDLHQEGAGYAVTRLNGVKHIVSTNLTASAAQANGIKYVAGSSPTTNESIGVHDVVN